jgi:hypothetical protein
MTTKPTKKHPRWIVIYYIHTPGSEWLGKGVEFFDEEEPARARGREMNDTSRPFYPPWDRQYLGAAQGYARPVTLKDYLKESDGQPPEAAAP